MPPWTDVDVFTAADRAAWEDRPLQSLPPGATVSPGSADGERSVDLINQLAGLRKPTKSPSQLVHGDLYGTVLFADSAAPGITDIILPKENERDLEDLPEEVRAQLVFHPVDTLDEVLSVALGSGDTPAVNAVLKTGV